MTFFYNQNLFNGVFSTGLNFLTSTFNPIIPTFRFPSLLSGWYNSCSTPTISFKSSIFGSNNSGNSASGILQTARKYLGYNERSGSYKLFTNGRREAWCADYVTYVVKEAFNKMGKMLPSGFGSSSVTGIMKWARKAGRFIKTCGANAAQNILNNVKSGDIIIFKNGMSHTGIVTGIKNGILYTIEGNTSDKVAVRHYSLNDSRITGFCRVT